MLRRISWSTPCSRAGFTSNLGEPHGIYHRPLDGLDLDTELQLFEQVAKKLAVDQINGRRAVAGGFSHRVVAECSCCDDEAFVTPAHHCSTEVPDRARANRALVSLALKHYLERKEVHPKDAKPINAAIARSAGNLDLD